MLHSKTRLFVVLASLASIPGCSLHGSGQGGAPDEEPTLTHAEIVEISGTAGFVTMTRLCREDPETAAELQLYMDDTLLPTLDSELELTTDLADLLLVPIAGEDFYNDWRLEIELGLLVLNSLIEMPSAGELLGDEWTEITVSFLDGSLRACSGE